MTNHDIRRVEEILDRALERPTSQRDAFVAEACAGDGDLRAEVSALLGEHRRMGGFLETAAVERFRGSLFVAGEMVGGYRIERVLGAGGGGTVYLAEQEQPRRHVALKAMHGGFSSDTAATRFQQEAEILARLQHPSIAHVYDAGLHEGLPYIVLEYVEGAETIVDFVERARMDRRARLLLFATVCDAVHAGHLKGVVHLDLKPGNILVLPAGHPKIIDFGIARVEGAGEPDGVAGTPPYMSPEQGGRGRDLDHRSDVYSLGVVLYELLTARLPHEVSGIPISDAVKKVCEEPPAALDSGIPADLRAIVMKAMASDPTVRYPSAAELAGDLRSFVDHRPVAARPAGQLRQLALWVRRHTALTAALVALTVVLVVGAVTSAVFAVRATAARDRERMQAYIANIAAADAALRAYKIAEARHRLDQTPPELRNWEYDHLAHRLDLSVRTVHGDLHGFSSLDSDATRVILAGRKERRLRVLAMDDGAVLHEEVLDDYPQRPVSSPDGRYLVWGEESGGLQIRESATLERIDWQRPHLRQLYDVAFRADGRRFATCSHDGSVLIWDWETLEVVKTLLSDGEPRYRVCFDPSGKLVAVSDLQRRIEVWSIEGSRLQILEDHSGIVTMLAFHPDGRRLVSGGLDATLRVWDVETGEQLAVHRDRSSHVTAGVLSEDGRAAVTGHVDGTLTVWDLEQGLARRVLWGHEHRIESIHLAPGGDALISTDNEGVTKLWDLDAEEPGRRYTHLPRDVAYSRDGSLMATGTFDGMVRLYSRRRPDEELVLRGFDSRVQAVGFRPDGTQVAAAFAGGEVMLWSVSGEPVQPLLAEAGPALALCFHSDDRHLASGHDGRTVVWDVETGQAVAALTQPGWVWVTLFTPDGASLITGTHSGELWLWDWRAGKMLRQLHAGEEPANCAELHRGTHRLAVGLGETVHVLDTRTWRHETAFPPFDATVQGVSWSPDGTRLAIATESDVRLVDPGNGKMVLRLLDTVVFGWDVAFRPDGNEIVAAIGGYEGQDCEVRIWRR